MLKLDLETEKQAVAAYREVWPRPSAVEPPKPVSTRWKFSGRWWSDMPARRGRR